MPKILYLQLLPILSGVQNFNLHLIDGIHKDSPGKYDIMLASAPGGSLPEALKDRNVKHIAIPCFRREISILDIPALLHLILIIKKHRFDIVHTNSSKPGLLGRLAATICKVPKIIHTAHGTAFQDFQSVPIRRFYILLEGLANRLCHHVVFVNHSDRSKCIDLGIISPQRSSTIYNALSPTLEIKLRHLASARITGTNELVTVGSVLRFSDQKNVITTIITACKACSISANLRFIFVGDGEHLELCRNIISSKGLSKSILLPGWDNDVIPYLASFDLFLLYSRWEALPISIIEAMFSALPVLGSDLPGICELVDDKSGFIVPLSDPDALCKRLIDIAKDPSSLKDLGSNAALSISAKCSFERMTSSYLEIYNV